MKKLVFSKDDILLALLEAKKDSFARAEIVKSLIAMKLKRLSSDVQFETIKLSKDFGSIYEIEKEFESYSEKNKKKCNNKIKKLNSLNNQINSLRKYRDELRETSLGNEQLDKLESNIENVFKWEKPVFYEDIFRPSES